MKPDGPPRRRENDNTGDVLETPQGHEIPRLNDVAQRRKAVGPPPTVASFGLKGVKISGVTSDRGDSPLGELHDRNWVHPNQDEVNRIKEAIRLLNLAIEDCYRYIRELERKH